MKYLCILTLVALTFELGQSQELKSLPYNWLPEEVPSPLRNPKDCGLGLNPGYICDPNNILTRHQLETLDWFLQGIAKTDNPDLCPCSRYHCEHFKGPRFYKVAIALIPSLRIPRNTNGEQVKVLDQAQTFAYRLVHDLWNMSSCEEDIVILYSRDDKALVTMTGKTAGRKLDAYSRRVLHSIVGQHFADGRINEGLLRMVYELTLVLNGNKYYQGLAQAQVGSTGHCLITSPLLFLLLALASCWFTRHLAASN